MPIVEVAITDEEFAAVAAGVKGAGSAADRVALCVRAQCRAVVAQHVARETARRLEAKGLPSSLAQIGLTPEQIALLEANVDAKIAAAKPA